MNMNRWFVVVPAKTRVRRIAAFLTAAMLTACTPEESIRWAFARAGATGEQQNEAVDIAWCESQLNPEAHNGSHVGLFQISERLHGWRRPGGDNLTDATHNTMVAAQLWTESGWRPWAACR